MKYSIFTIVALATVGLASPIPEPAGGFYNGAPIPQTQICNCNNPATKETQVTSLCQKVGGSEMYQTFYWDPTNRQHMCRFNINIKDVFTKAGCVNEYGEEYNPFCTNWLR